MLRSTEVQPAFFGLFELTEPRSASAVAAFPLPFLCLSFAFHLPFRTAAESSLPRRLPLGNAWLSERQRPAVAKKNESGQQLRRRTKAERQLKAVFRAVAKKNESGEQSRRRTKADSSREGEGRTKEKEEGEGRRRRKKEKEERRRRKKEEGEEGRRRRRRRRKKERT